MPAFFQVAITAKITGACSKPKGLIVAGKKNFPFQLHNDVLYVLRLAAAVNKNGGVVIIQYLPGFLWRRREGRTGQTATVLVTAELALFPNPGGRKDIFG